MIIKTLLEQYIVNRQQNKINNQILIDIEIDKEMSLTDQIQIRERVKGPISALSLNIQKYSVQIPVTDTINQNERGQVSRQKLQRKFKHRSEVVKKQQTISASPPELKQLSIKSSEKQIGLQQKSSDIKHNVVLFEFIQPLSNINTQNSRHETPKNKNINIKNNKKFIKQQLDQQIINNKKLENNPSKSSIHQSNSNQTPKNQNSQAPRLVLSRYTANRRLEAQKQQENNQNLASRLQKEESPQQQPVVVQKPYGHQKINRQQISGMSTPPLPNKIAKTQRPIIPTYPQSPQNQHVQQIKILSRNNGRTQLKTKNPKQTQQQKQPKQASNKKRSNIFLSILKKIFYHKLQDILDHIKGYSYKDKIKQTKFIPIFIIKIKSVYNRIINQFYQISFNKINKYNVIKIQKYNNTNKKVNKIGNVENMIIKNKKIIISCLNRIFHKKICFAWNKLYAKKKKNYFVQKKIISILESLFKRKIFMYFQHVGMFAKLHFNVKCQYTKRIFTIMKQYHLKSEYNAFRKLKSLQKKQQLTKPQKQLSVREQKAQVHSKKSLMLLQKQLQNNTKKLATMIQQSQKQKQQYLNKIQKIKMICEQLILRNQQRKKISLELKQRAQSMEMPEQHYIQQPQLLTDTKFPILYELYIKIQKSGMDDIKVSDLLQSFQFLQQQMQNDQLVKSWIQMLQNHEKKKQINQYQGYFEQQRFAAKKAYEEQIMLVQMIRGYIKEKYTWELVKNALNNISIQV